MNREEESREAQLRREIEELEAVTAEFEAVAGDLLKGSELAPSNARAREEMLELLGVNYVGPEMLGRLLYGDENKFQKVDLDYVKLNEILNEHDEWESAKRKFESYALVFKPPISFLELRDRANEAASALDMTPAFYINDGGNFEDTEAFATEAPKTGSWELVRRETVPGSTSKRWNDQKALIVDKPALAPTSFAALAALLVGQHLADDTKLYNGRCHFGRTSTWCAASGGPVQLGHMIAIGAFVSGSGHANDLVGLAVSRNLRS